MSLSLWSIDFQVENREEMGGNILLSMSARSIECQGQQDEHSHRR